MIHSSILDFAHWYSSSFGFNLVPLGNDKRPVMTGGVNKSGRPYRFNWEDWQATAQPANVWDKFSGMTWWGDVQGIAVICGRDDVVCVDFDRATFDAVAEFLDALGIETDWIVQSPGGGYHVYVRCPGIEWDKGKIDRPGRGAAHIEMRHVGHYVALPGSAHPSGGTYTWRGKPPTEKPLVVDVDALMLAYDTVTVQPVAKAPTVHLNGGGPVSVYANGAGNANEVTAEYVRKAFDDELATLGATREGGRNMALNAAAFNLAQFVADGLLAESEVVYALEAVAMGIGLGDEEVSATIASGMAAGRKHPRGLRLRQRVIQSDSGIEWAATGGDFAEIADMVVTLPDVRKAWKLFDYPAEEGGVLDIWMEEHGEDWIYVPDETRWYSWAGSHWSATKAEGMGVQLQGLLRQLNEMAAEAVAEAKRSDDKATLADALAWWNTSKRSKARIFSVRYMAQEQRAVDLSKMNPPDALNCANGVLNLNDFTLAPHDRTQRFTYCLPYAYQADIIPHRWMQFLDEIFVDTDGQPDYELQRLVQQAIGYSLTGETHHEAMFWLSGEGSNGKTVFLTILRALLGHMAIAIDFQQLGQPGNYDLASLPGKRVVVSTEAERGGGLAEGYIKRIVSGEVINARAIRGEPFEFKSTAKLWWAMNDKPTVKDTSNAIWRRLKLIEFRRIFTEEEKDTHLIPRLLGELSGILNWALYGLADLRKAGRFVDPESVKRARDEYRRENNPVLQWLEENTTYASAGAPAQKSDWTKAKEAYENYRYWSQENGRQPLNANNFGRELTRLRIKKDRLPGGMGMGYALAIADGADSPAKQAQDILDASGL